MYKAMPDLFRESAEFIRRGPEGDIEEPVIDVVIFRQNTECLYSGVEWTNPPPLVHEALMSHPAFMSNFGQVPPEEISVSARIFTRNRQPPVF
jgi:3-isopropylmalate dehydrogenase